MTTDLDETNKPELLSFVNSGSISTANVSTPKSTYYVSLKKPEKHFSIQKERNFRLLITIVFVAGSLAIFFVAQHRKQSSYHIIALCVLLTQFIWFISFLVILFSMEHIHFIQVKRIILPKTGLLVLPYSYIEFRNWPMRSISNMCSIHGSNMSAILSKAMNITFGMVFSAASMKWAQHNLDISDSISLIFLLLAAHGGGILTRWELENNKLSLCLHQFGALLGFGAGPLAFAIYQRFSWLSCLLMGITWIVLLIFVCLEHCITANNKETKQIHQISLLCICVELIAYLNGIATVILFVYCMDGDVIL